MHFKSIFIEEKFNVVKMSNLQFYILTPRNVVKGFNLTLTLTSRQSSFYYMQIIVKQAKPSFKVLFILLFLTKLKRWYVEI
jgi:hypothetical protein